MLFVCGEFNRTIFEKVTFRANWEERTKTMELASAESTALSVASLFPPTFVLPRQSAVSIFRHPCRGLMRRQTRHNSAVVFWSIWVTALWQDCTCHPLGRLAFPDSSIQGWITNDVHRRPSRRTSLVTTGPALGHRHPQADAFEGNHRVDRTSEVLCLRSEEYLPSGYSSIVNAFFFFSFESRKEKSGREEVGNLMNHASSI